MTSLFFHIIRKLVLLQLMMMLICLSHIAHSITNQTINTIQGRDPFYLSFDNNQTVANDLSGLLSITLPNNQSFDVNHNQTIVLPDGDYKLHDIKTHIPANLAYPLQTILKNGNYLYQIDAINPSYQISGLALAEWHDSNGQIILDLNTPFSFCSSKTYTLTMTVTGDKNSNILVQSQYGYPNQKQYTPQTKVYTFAQTTKKCPKIAYIAPTNVNDRPIYDGPKDQWLPNKGFLVQSDTDYSKNYPTIGMSFLTTATIVIEDNNQELTWQAIHSSNMIRVLFIDITPKSVIFRLSGPNFSFANGPGTAIPTFTPTTVILEGKNATGDVVLRYGFHLKHWLLVSTDGYTYYQQKELCTKSGNYRLPTLAEMTNASLPPSIIGTSPGNHFQRVIGGGYTAEYGGETLMDFWTEDGYGVSGPGAINISNLAARKAIYCISL